MFDVTVLGVTSALVSKQGNRNQTREGLTMTTMRGIALDTWADINGDCAITYGEVNKSNVQILLGHPAGSLHLVLSESGLASLIDVAQAALREVRAANQ